MTYEEQPASSDGALENGYIPHAFDMTDDVLALKNKLQIELVSKIYGDKSVEELDQILLELTQDTPGSFPTLFYEFIDLENKHGATDVEGQRLFSEYLEHEGVPDEEFYTRFADAFSDWQVRRKASGGAMLH